VVLLAHRLGPPGGRPLASPLVGHSEAVLRLHQRIASVAALSAPVLIRGETGTGKELVAEAIARGGPRAAGPFITVNLAAVPATTAATELFGHGAGAFTGATRPREGLFAQAHGGSLFLDEIGEVPIEVQAMLLRVLETGEIQPLGAPRRIADVRVIAATDAPLEDKVRCGAFREALFHRLAGLPLRTPSLEERRDDVGRLFFHFLRRELDGSGHGELLSRLGDEDPWLPASTFAALAQVRLPGNVRQLANLVRQMVILATEGRPVTGALEGLISIDQVPAGAPAAEPDSRPRRAVDEAALLDALRANAWKPSVAARQLGISRTTLYSLIDRSARIRKATEIPMDELRACLEACAGDIDAMAAQLEVSRKSLTLRIRETGLVRRRS
jgi:two-component system nitrogen regulation response regulator GlnG